MIHIRSGPPLPPTRPLRVLAVCSGRYRQPGYDQHAPILDALERRFVLTPWHVDDRWPAGIEDFDDYEQYDAVLWFVRFREMLAQPAFRWGTYAGVRLMYDQDANQDFNQLGGARYFGKWPGVFKRNEFHVLVCTGAKTRDHLRSKGVAAEWLPKAVERGRFQDLRSARSGACVYGQAYRSRMAMQDYLAWQGIPYERITKCPYSALNEQLNRFQIGLVCNMEGIVQGTFGKVLNRLQRRRGIRLAEGPELMLKNFEVAAAGCVCVCDYIPEMRELGFVDGETVVTYTSFAELVDKLRYYLERPDDLRAIGQRSASVCAERHTWDDRIDELDGLIRRLSRHDRGDSLERIASSQ